MAPLVEKEEDPWKVIDQVKQDIDYVNLENIQAARAKIKDKVHKTPILTSSSLDKHFGNAATFHYKCEHLQKIGAFKIRGALNAITSTQAKVITTHSSGNHAQAVALACQLVNKKCIIVMPKDSPLCKVNAVRDTYGAEIRFCEPNQKAREALCDEVIAEYGPGEIEMIHPYDNCFVSCGQGTLGLEMLEQVKDLDAVVVAVGGGGLLAGVATAIKESNPNIKVIAAEPVNVNDCYRSFREFNEMQTEATPDFFSDEGSGKRYESDKFKFLMKHLQRFGDDDVKHPWKNLQCYNENTETIADSVKTNLGRITYPIVMSYVDEVIQVSEEAIKEAQFLVMERLKQVIEPGAAVAACAAWSEEFSQKFPNCKNVGVVLCGGNFDLTNLPNLIPGAGGELSFLKERKSTAPMAVG